MASTMFGMTGQQQNIAGFNMQKFQEDLNKIKTSGVNTDDVIQNLMNSGRITQQQYNEACQRARMIQRMMGTTR